MEFPYYQVFFKGMNGCLMIPYSSKGSPKGLKGALKDERFPQRARRVPQGLEGSAKGLKCSLRILVHPKGMNMFGV